MMVKEKSVSLIDMCLSVFLSYFVELLSVG